MFWTPVLDSGFGCRIAKFVGWADDRKLIKPNTPTMGFLASAHPTLQAWLNKKERVFGDGDDADINKASHRASKSQPAFCATGTHGHYA